MSGANPRVDDLEAGAKVVLRNTGTDAEFPVRVAATGDPMTLELLGGPADEVVEAEDGYELVWASRSYIIRLPWRMVSSGGTTVTGRAVGESTWTTRRAEPRSTIAVPVRIYSPGKILKATTRDVSAGGLRLQVDGDTDMTAGDVVRMRLSMPDHDLNGTVEVLRRVQDVGADTAELACRFVEMKEEHRRTLRQLCQGMLSLDPSTAPQEESRPRQLTRALVNRLTRG